MKCPKCNYTSFDYLDSCKKCGKDLTEHKEKHNLRSLLFAGGATAAAGAANAAGDDSFGFDFMEEPAGAGSDDGFVLDETNADFADSEDEGFSFDNDDAFNFDEEE